MRHERRVVLSEDARSTAGILLRTIVAVEYGGTFMLRVVRGRIPMTPFQRAFARAGHAHAGVLVIAALVRSSRPISSGSRARCAVFLLLERSSPDPDGPSPRQLPTLRLTSGSEGLVEEDEVEDVIESRQMGAVTCACMGSVRGLAYPYDATRRPAGMAPSAHPASINLREDQASEMVIRFLRDRVFGAERIPLLREALAGTHPQADERRDEGATSVKLV